jgi:hypothetical protein
MLFGFRNKILFAVDFHRHVQLRCCAISDRDLPSTADRFVLVAESSLTASLDRLKNLFWS